MSTWWLLPLLAGLSQVTLSQAQAIDCRHAENMESCGALDQFQCEQMGCCYDFGTGACFRDKRTTPDGPCIFPFVYIGKSYQGCIPINDNQRWCSLTPNWDDDQRHGFCPPAGNWDAWSALGVCSSQCGGGTRTRTRTCVPSNAQCPGGISTDTQQCNTHACSGNWGEWTPVGACSMTCGIGTIQRTRTCQPFGAQCRPGITSDVQPCNTQACPGSWGQWSGFGACTRTCGAGTMQRSRDCLPTGTTCPNGGNIETQVCNPQACLGSWGEWSTFGACSTNCGGGTAQRTRVCQPSGAQCPTGTLNTDTQLCHTQACAGTWSAWGAYGTCTATCGGGQKTRSRTCSPANAECSGQEYMVVACNEQACVTGSWGAWSTVGECSRDCGDGTVQRTRVCQPSGAQCPTGTLNTDTQPCNTKACTADCDIIICKNGGTCLDGSGICACAPGFTGQLCDKDIRCKGSSPCEHEGVCTNTTQGGLNCVCTEQWTGRHCAHANLCLHTACGHGECVMVEADYVCECDEGWEGLHCDSDKLPLVIGIAAGTYVVVMMLILLLVLSIIRCR